MGLSDYLQLPQVQHALVAATLVAVIAGLIGPFVVTRRAAFAVHGVAELGLTGAAAGLLWLHDGVLGALLGSLIVAAAISILGVRESERDAAIGVTLGFGLGVGVYLLSRLHGSFASQATNILFGQIVGVSWGQVKLLLVVAIGVLVAVLALYRPLLFASVDPDVAAARGVPVRVVGMLFMFVLALTVTEAAQIVGTLLVLSLTITPAAAAHRLAARPSVVAGLAILFALVASDGGLVLSLQYNQKASVFITTISFGLYVAARLVGTRMRVNRRTPAEELAGA
jgi:zinc/manganese transport system permease protein